MIPIDKLRIHPVNKQIYVSDEKRKAELLESIKEHGILEPLIVTPDNNEYSILSGARRFACTKELGYTEVPCIVSIVKNPTLAIIEHNKYRQKSPIEIYNEYQLLRKILGDRARAGSIRGRIREIAAEKLNVSHGYLSMLEQVIENKQEIPEVVKKLEAGRETVYSAFQERNHSGEKTSELTSIVNASFRLS